MDPRLLTFIVAVLLSILDQGDRLTRGERIFDSRLLPWICGAATAVAVAFVWPDLNAPGAYHDERAYVVQARLLASFSWTAPTPPVPMAWEMAHMFVEPRVFAKYPPGHAIALVPGVWLGMTALMPVLLVRPETGDAAPTEAPPLRRILVPLDLSAESEAVLETVAEIAILAEAGVTLLHVVEPFLDLVDPAAPYPLAVDSRITEGRLNEAERRLERAAGRLRDAGIRVETRILESTSAAGGILEALERDEADLVAMTTHGEGGVRRLVLGSVTDKVIRGSRKPVLAMRPPAPKEEP